MQNNMKNKLQQVVRWMAKNILTTVFCLVVVALGTAIVARATSVTTIGENISTNNLTAAGTTTLGTLNGILKGTSGAVGTATAGTDYEAPISAGTSGQYYRGDKTWQTLNQAAVDGLTTASSPTFGGLTLSGNATVTGDLITSGTIGITSTDDIAINISSTKSASDFKPFQLTLTDDRDSDTTGTTAMYSRLFHDGTSANWASKIGLTGNTSLVKLRGSATGDSTTEIRSYAGGLEFRSAAGAYTGIEEFAVYDATMASVDANTQTHSITKGIYFFAFPNFTSDTAGTTNFNSMSALMFYDAHRADLGTNGSQGLNITYNYPIWIHEQTGQKGAADFTGNTNLHYIHLGSTKTSGDYAVYDGTGKDSYFSGANLTLNNTVNPAISAVDTNGATAILKAFNSSVAVGSESNHPVNIYSNGMARVTVAAAGEVSFINGAVPAKKTTDPCGSGFPEGSIFYNDTGNYMCYCNGTNNVKMSDDTTTCF